MINMPLTLSFLRILKFRNRFELEILEGFHQVQSTFNMTVV